ncbi:SRPBCC family protein [Streptomyces silvisoli]|uniref:SRPBCC family protein n=1 Tax=Streptomyces silvisoli TaxID=3034235 RepID=A0ABT5ZGH6_9ACTN|nr:SRPBCC family protein [Streptomyces silvisoli]MDF3288919.1 SRPBCC family protein [Streptomyces silvisoli]
MDWCRYRFRDVWRLDAPPAEVYAVLERAEEYPRWWPQVRRVDPIDEWSGTARFRSVLPYELVVTAREARRDPAAGVLEIAMTGDLEGWARWTLGPGGTGTRATFEQQVIVRKPVMRWLSVPGRLFFRANHALMMRAGRRGLCALLAERSEQARENGV